MTLITQQVMALLEQEPHLPPVVMAEKLQVSEWEIIAALPEKMASVTDGNSAHYALEQLASFGKVTTIMTSFGSIYEVKAAFPAGKLARGYYNLMAKEGQLDGHLKLDSITNIAFVSKSLRGRESHYIGFYASCGSNIFKIYLGRDQQGTL